MFGTAATDTLITKPSGTRATVSAMALAASLALTVPAWGQVVVNPGFETNDTTGWTLSGGQWTDATTWPPPPSTWAGAPDSYTITNAGSFDSITGAPMVFGGDHALRLNDSNPGYGVTALAQTVNGYAGNKLYYAWNAVLEPSHGPTDSPSFIIKVVNKTTGRVVNNIAYSAYTAQNTAIFRAAGNFVTSDWKVEEIDMITGHDYEMLFVALDCPHSAHAGYVYVDGFGSAIPVANADVDFDPATDITRGSDVLIPIGGTPDIDTAQAFYTTQELNDGDVNPHFVGGTLQFASAGEVTVPFTVDASGGTVDTNGFDVTVSGGFTGTGGMTKTGAGALQLTGTITTLNEGFTVEQGTLLVGSALSSLDVTVNAGARLGGTGTIVADVRIGAGGTLAPGNSPGTLVVAAGDVTLADTATFAVEIDGATYRAAGGAGSYDRLALTSGATFQPNGILAPALRGISGGNNTYTPAVGDTFVIVDGGAIGSGAFDSVAQPGAGLAANTRFDVLYGATSITATVTPGNFGTFGAANGWKRNAIRAAAGLEPFRPAAGARSGAFRTLYDGLYGMNAADLGYAFSQIGGEIHADTLQMALASARDVGQAALAAGQEPWGCPPAVQSPGQFTRPAAAGAGDGCGVASASKGATAWGRYTSQSSEAGEDATAYRYRRMARGLIAGVNLVNIDGTRLGLSGAWSDGDMHSDVGSRADIDTWSAFVYGAHRFGNLSLGATVGYNKASVDTVRTIGLTTGSQQASDSYRIETLSFAAEARYDIALGDRSVLRPVAGIEVARSTADAVSEGGAATVALAMPKEKWTSARTKLGAELAIGVGNPVEAGVFGNWRHELKDTTAVRVAQLGAAAWRVSSVDAGKDGFEAGGQLGVKLSNAAKLRFEYALVRQGEYHTDRVQAGLSVKF